MLPDLSFPMRSLILLFCATVLAIAQESPSTPSLPDAPSTIKMHQATDRANFIDLDPPDKKSKRLLEPFSNHLFYFGTGMAFAGIVYDFEWSYACQSSGRCQEFNPDLGTHPRHMEFYSNAAPEI